MGSKKTQLDIEELYKWIDNYTISRQKRNINRDFSDAVPLAEMLKQHYPKLVDLHNYTSRNSVSQKLINWETLNRKVLTKLDINLSSNVMKQLAHSVPGAIEKILFNIKEKINTKEIPREPIGDIYFVEGLSASISGSIIPVKQRNSTKTLDHKVVPVDDYTRMENELEEKNEAIKILTNKVEHLENVLTIKEERINDLTKQLQQNSQERTSRNFFSNIF